MKQELYAMDCNNCGIVRRWKGHWTQRQMKRMEALAIVLAFVAAFSVFTIAMMQVRKPGLGHLSGNCRFLTIFSFGDSNSDTGSMSAAFPRVPSPYGQTFFGKPSGRYSDGRLIIDFIAEKLGVPYLSPYLDSIGSNFKHGANFAAAGSTIKPGSLLHLTIQLAQFDQFKARTIELYNQAKKSSYAKTSLPTPEDLSKAVYIFDTGQNDLFAGLTNTTEDQVLTSIPGLIDEFSLGMESHNEVAQEFNKQLKDKVSQLRTKFEDALLVYVDIYSAKYSLISEAKDYGFVNPFKYCCGHHGDYSVKCGEIAVVNGTPLYGSACSNPSEYISWDSVHYTEAANQWVANHILDGSFSDPQIPIAQTCPNNSVHSQ
ncbi:hypothetical protein CsSME_00021746 [Camellia sinensis var. sinensis]